MERLKNENELETKITELTADLSKAKDIAELGAKAINSEYLSMLFDSQTSLTPLSIKNLILLEIYKNVQELVHFSLKQKEENSKLNEQITELLKNDSDNDKNTVAKLRSSVSSLEKQNNGLLEKIKGFEKMNNESQQQIKALNVKIEEATEKLKNVEKECQKLKKDNRDLLDIKKQRENEALTAAEKVKRMNKEMNEAVTFFRHALTQANEMGHQTLECDIKEL